MSQTCCSLSRAVKGTLTAVSLTALVALVLLVFVPWQTLDAAAPAGGDDLLTNHQILQPVSFARNHCGIGNTQSVAQVLHNWHYTGNDNDSDDNTTSGTSQPDGDSDDSNAFGG